LARACLCHEAVTVRTRTGRNITEYVDNLRALTDLGRRFVLDGELVAESGRAGDFYRLGPNLRSSSRRDFTFVAFVLDEENLCARRYCERRRLLDELELFGPGWCTIRALAGPPRVLLDPCAELDVEGVVAKRVDSPYRPGVRSGDWLKLKRRTGNKVTRRSDTADELASKGRPERGDEVPPRSPPGPSSLVAVLSAGVGNPLRISR
jgi:bifunctional non-homologous end joining protein LigD